MRDFDCIHFKVAAELLLYAQSQLKMSKNIFSNCISKLNKNEEKLGHIV